MNVTVLFPWRPQPDRMQAFEYVVGWYKQAFPNFQLLAVDTDHEKYCISAVRNRGVEYAKDSDVIIVNDGDTFPSKDPLIKAINWVKSNNGIAIPYTDYYTVTRSGTKQYFSGTHIDHCHKIWIEDATSGVNVFTPDAWKTVGGNDERFLGWGGEDTAWRKAADMLAPVKVIEGQVHAFIHSDEHKQNFFTDDNPNFTLLKRYLGISTKEQMLDMINEPGRMVPGPATFSLL